MKGFLPKGDKNVGKCFNAGKNRKDNPVHHPFDLKFKKNTSLIKNIIKYKIDLYLGTYYLLLLSRY